MARTAFSDYLHNMRFHADAIDLAGVDRLVVDGRPQAGFSAITTPEYTVEVAEYKEGQMVYTQKYPGNATVNDITLSRGAATTDSAFYDWIRQVIEGTGDYRATLSIKHYHRVGGLQQEAYPATGNPAVTDINIAFPLRTYTVFEAWPTRHKVSGDLEATSSDISLQELDVVYEYFTVTEPALA
jgi:phage tail-like protein